MDTELVLTVCYVIVYTALSTPGGNRRHKPHRYTLCAQWCRCTLFYSLVFLIKEQIKNRIQKMVWHLYFPMNLSSLEVFISLYCFKLYAFYFRLANPFSISYKDSLAATTCLPEFQPPLQRTEFSTDIPFFVSHLGCVCVAQGLSPLELKTCLWFLLLPCCALSRQSLQSTCWWTWQVRWALFRLFALALSVLRLSDLKMLCPSSVIPRSICSKLLLTSSVNF